MRDSPDNSGPPPAAIPATRGDNPGLAVGTVGAPRPMTDLRRTEMALAESEERYRRFFNDDLSGAFISTPDGRVLACNPAFARIFGFGSVEEVLQIDAADLYPDPAARREFLELLRRDRKLEYFEGVLRHRTGRPVHVVENVSAVFDDKGEIVEVHGYLFDNTERKKLEEQFLQAQKMEAVGRLAGGVAHDFNNLLTAILGYSDLLLNNLPETSPQRTLIQEIVKAGERASELTRQLLAFSRKQVLRPQLLDLNRVVGNIATMMKLVLGEKARLVTTLEPDLRRVKADPGQIEQVLMNLAVNARDAMSQGGQLAVVSANVDLTIEDCRPLGELRPGPYSLLTVSDTGCGMSADVMAHLFEPFFTTKEVGKGTGLGLATAYGIIKQSGGHIGVVSTPGLGTTFSVYLPSAAPAAALINAAAAEPAQRGGETLLLVEDEAGLRGLMRTILGRQGYHILEAGHGGEALDVCQNHAGHIDLLVTDVVMPRMSGRELAGRLAPLRPGMKVLYLSGYTDDPTLRSVLLSAAADFLPKPFTPDSLARKVRDVLDAPL